MWEWDWGSWIYLAGSCGLDAGGGVVETLIFENPSSEEEADIGGGIALGGAGAVGADNGGFIGVITGSGCTGASISTGGSSTGSGFFTRTGGGAVSGSAMEGAEGVPLTTRTGAVAG